MPPNGKADTSPSITSSLTQDDDSSICTSEERYNNLHFEDLITLPKDDNKKISKIHFKSLLL